VSWVRAGTWLMVMSVAWLALETGATAHYDGTALLHLRERTPGEFAIAFTPSTPMQRSVHAVRFVYPAQCRSQGERLACGEPGLSGELSAEHLPLHGEVIVQIDWSDGRTLTRVLSSRRNHVQLPSASAGRVDTLVITYVRLGVEHIFAGADHVLFVVGLLLLTGFRRSLFGTITAFTLAHSVTLALDVTGVIHVRPAPVEALIAASLVLVAAEALSSDDSATRQRPWLVAFVFGLFHGLGFGGALREVGLPAANLAYALASFNVGVELGQCALVGAIGALCWLAQRAPWRGEGASAGVRYGPWLRAASAYVVGGSGAYWFFDRVLTLVWPGV